MGKSFVANFVYSFSVPPVLKIQDLSEAEKIRSFRMCTLVP